MVLETEKRFGTVDVLVNDSGATWKASTLEMSLESFDLVVRVNRRGMF